MTHTLRSQPFAQPDQRPASRQRGQGTRRTVKLLASAGICALMLAACGGRSTSGTASNARGTADNARVISHAQHAAASRQQIEQAFMKLSFAKRGSMGEPEWITAGEDPADLQVDAGCSINVVMTTPDQVAMYRDTPGSDDNLVENPSGTVGVKVIGTEDAQAGCLRDAARVLSGF